MRVADYIMQRLVCAGVRHVFQVTGRGALFLNDAVAKHADLTPVSLHHEQACAFAAIGYAEQTESIGVCLVSTGCAATNTLTGFYQHGKMPCHASSSPGNISCVRPAGLQEYRCERMDSKRPILSASCHR